MGLAQKQEFEIICDGDSGKCCAVFDVSDNASETMRAARIAGWSQDRGSWLCPMCQGKRDGACEEDR